MVRSDAVQTDPGQLGGEQSRRNLIVLVMLQAFLGAQMPIIFVAGGLAGSMLSTNPCLATLPISMVVFGSMTTAPWIAPLMQRRGRKFGFTLGALAGAFGAMIAAYGLHINSFPVLLIGSYFSGIYMSSQGFLRFAAADCVSASYRPKAISYVMAGGLVSAIWGPQLNKIVFDASVIPFLGTYLAIVVINLIGIFLIGFLNLADGADAPAEKQSSGPQRSWMDFLKTPTILIAIICGMVSYALMNLIMTSTPLAVLGCGLTNDNANDIVSAHVLAMFIPSFFTGHLIVRFGAPRIIALGLVILGLAGLVALSGVTLGHFFGALILLGIGWNFGFVGATSLVAASHAPHERGKVQGLNDMMVFGCVTIASLASGGLLNCSGGTPVQGWSAVNIAMIPFLLLAGGALIWLSRSKATKQMIR